MRQICKLFLCFSLFVLFSCNNNNRHRKNRSKKYRHENSSKSEYSKLTISDESTTSNNIVDNYFAEEIYLPFEESGGVKYVWVRINGVDKRFIFDTGASSISLSNSFADELAQKGTITESDILGVQSFQDATGAISKGIRVNLHSVSIADHSIYDVEASICLSENAPLLLGQSFLERFGTIEIDNWNKRIILHPR